MTAKKQISANLLNAQKSTRPKMSEGERPAAANSLTHGLTAVADEEAVLPDEDWTTRKALQERLFEQYKPRTALGAELVENLTSTLWRLGRVPRIENGILERVYWEERISNARAAGRQSDPIRKDLQDLVGSPTDEERAAQEQLQAVEKEAHDSLAIAAAGFLRDASGLNMLDKLTRHETRLMNTLKRILRELEELEGQRVEGEIIDEVAE